jgi:SAM-dependent methyltransferase
LDLTAHSYENPKFVSLPEPRCEPRDRCPICGWALGRERFESRDLLLSVPGAFRYVECAACHTVYQNPCVGDEDLALCYPPGYFTHEVDLVWEGSPAPPGSLRDLVKRAVRHAADGVPDADLGAPLRLLGRLLALHPGLRRRARLGLVDGLAPTAGNRGRCLEVGPGFGLDLWRLSRLGWEAFGLEVDPVAAANARARSGCEVRVGTLASTDYPDGHFDLIYMSHVFEHLRDPALSLRRCLDLLGAGGLLVLVYPNPGALTARTHGHLSVVWDPPRHLVLPPPPAVLALLEETGFGDVRVHTSVRHAAVNSEAARRRGRGQRWDPLQLASPGPVDRLFWLLEAALLALGLPVGEEVIVHARRPEAGG